MKKAILILVIGLFWCSNVNALPECKGTVAKNWTNCQGTQTWASGSKYVGEYKDGFRSGQGTFSLANGDKYAGEWKNNQPHGQGTYTHARGDKYVGGWKDNKQHGQGTKTWPDGNKYVGEWKDSKQHGQGTATFANGDKYVGGWKDHKKHGQGTLTRVNGKIDNGIWNKNKLVKRNKIGISVAAKTEKKEIKKKKGEVVVYHSDANSISLKFRWFSERYNEATAVKHCARYEKFVFYFAGDQSSGVNRGQLYHCSSKNLSRSPTTGGVKVYFTNYDPNHNFAQQQKKQPEQKKQPKQSPDDNKVVAAAMGSGFFVTRAGHLITNYHVIKECKAVKANILGKEIHTDIIAIDKTNDLAIIKAEMKPSKVFPVSNEDVSLMQDVIVAGFPLGKRVSSAIKIHKGSVTALAGFGDNYSNFQTDATINQGNSGGPIMTQKGNVVGVAVQLIAAEHAQNVFFGVKSSTLRTFAKANNLTFESPNYRDMSNKDLGNLITAATVYLECWMTFAKIKQIIAQAENRKAFYSEYQQ